MDLRDTAKIKKQSRWIKITHMNKMNVKCLVIKNVIIVLPTSRVKELWKLKQYVRDWRSWSSLAD